MDYYNQGQVLSGAFFGHFIYLTPNGIGLSSQISYSVNSLTNNSSLKTVGVIPYKSIKEMRVLGMENYSNGESSTKTVTNTLLFGVGAGLLTHAATSGNDAAYRVDISYDDITVTMRILTSPFLNLRQILEGEGVRVFDSNSNSGAMNQDALCESNNVATTQNSANTPSAVSITGTPESLLKRAFLFMEDGEFDKADLYCEKVLDLDPENARAYLGKLMVELKVKKQEDLCNCEHPLDASNNYHKVLRFADSELSKTLTDYNVAAKERSNNNGLLYEKKIDNIAQAFIYHYKSESFIKQKEKATSEIVLLEKMIVDFPNILKKANAAKEEIESLTSQRNSLTSSKSSLGVFKRKEKNEIDVQIATIENKLRNVQSEFDALKIDIDKYESLEQIQELLKNENEKINSILQEESVYSNLSITYEEAINECSNDEKVFDDMIAAYPEIAFLASDVGDRIPFGKYKQSAKGNDSTPIEWTILAKEDNHVLLLADKGIINAPYNQDNIDVAWDKCTLRTWLNNAFYNEAFTDREQKLIESKFLEPETTTDKVFLISYDEAQRYLNPLCFDCYPTEYALERCIIQKEKLTGFSVREFKTTNPDLLYSGWWLRTKGESENTVVAFKNPSKKVHYNVTTSTALVRPAIWIEIQ